MTLEQGLNLAEAWTCFFQLGGSVQSSLSAAVLDCFLDISLTVAASTLKLTKNFLENSCGTTRSAATVASR